MSCVELGCGFQENMREVIWCPMQGGVEVAKDIRFADKAVYFPWRPR